MDIKVIIAIWVVFAIIRAVIKNSAKKPQTTNQEDTNNDPRAVANNKKSQFSNRRDDDKRAVKSLKSKLKQRTSTATKVRDNQVILETANSIKSYDDMYSDKNNTSYDAASIQEQYSNVENDFEGVVGKDFIDEIRLVRQDNVELYQNKIEPYYYQSNIEKHTTEQVKPNYISSNMFEQAIIYETIFNRKGKKIAYSKLQKR